MHRLVYFFRVFIVMAAVHMAFQAPLLAQPSQANPPPPQGSDELSLEEQLNNELGISSETDVEGLSDDELMMLDETGLSAPTDPNYLPPPSAMEVTAGNEDDLGDDDSGRVRYIEPRYAENGYSFGVQVWQQSFDIKASMLVTSIIAGQTTTDLVDISSSSNNFQNIGVTGRYAILPYEQVGSELILTVGTTLNHGDKGLSAIYTARGEFNLAYTIEISKDTALYALAGVGYEIFIGDEIQKIISSSGGGVLQGGAGMKMGEKFGLELLYSRSYHKVSDDFFKRAGDQAISQGATSYSPQESSVTTEGILGRILITF